MKEYYRNELKQNNEQYTVAKPTKYVKDKGLVGSILLHHSMNMYGRVQLKLHTFLTLTLDRSE
jgi:hypothetical protein